MTLPDRFKDIFLRNISWSVDEGGLSDTFAAILHDEPFLALSPGVLINFKVTLYPDRKFKGARPHSGTGLLTLPSSEIGRIFLERFGDGARVRRPLILGGRKLSIQISSKGLRQDLVTAVSHTPYISREQMLVREQEKKELDGEVGISAIQFGRECRDGAFSVEWKRVFTPRGRIIFESDKREIQVHLPEDDNRGLSSGQIVAFRFSGIETININRDRRVPSIYFKLNHPSSFYECKGGLIPISHLDESHLHVAPFTSAALIVTLISQDALGEFRRMAKRIHHRISNYSPQIVERRLYSKSLLNDVDRWLNRLPYGVGFQCDALMRSPSCLVDAQEMQSLKQPIIVLVMRHGEKKTTSFLKHFANTLDQLWFSEDENVVTHTVLGVFKTVEGNFDFNVQPPSSSTEGLMDCFHVSVTPTAIHLSGN
jgi:RNA-dependent RNA polymerase